MLNHRRDLQFTCRPARPDLKSAGRLGRVLGVQYSEIDVAAHYLSGWTGAVPGHYRDTLVHVGVDQVAMIEMLATMIARLLDDAPAERVDRVLRTHPTVAAVMGGTDLERALEPACGPWRRENTSDRQNLLADFLANARAERDHLALVHEFRDRSDDPDVRLLLSYVVARTDTHRRECAEAVAALTEEPEERVYAGKPRRADGTGAADE
ncbi:Mn-containing catalase [Kribbella aluminosa]|uniref:Mn-containing catalase n=1 Tax=Kribbella aluminosa TaxID=416017 RepID=A0ABS4UK50_9ACTN|nr:manganese catalase family protein [Kribbella aluminosa]MBP2352025.1 Mn-containing catalase [Kribbella aluminosa]